MGHQFTSMDYLSLVQAPLWIRWTVCKPARWSAGFKCAFHSCKGGLYPPPPSLGQKKRAGKMRRGLASDFFGL
jgi:hypothetical protein